MGAPSGVPLFSGLRDSTHLTTGHHYQNLTNFTVSFWTKNPDVRTSTTDYAGLVSMGALANSPGFCCFVNNFDRGNKRVSFQTRSVENTTSTLSFPFADMRTGRWHHVVFTHDFEGGRSCLYLNGKLKDAKPDQTELVNPAMAWTYDGSYVTIGNRAQDPTYPLSGMVAQLSVWNRALSESEVLDLGLQPTVGDETDLLGYWPLDSGMGGLFDRVANGRAQHSFLIDSAADTAFVDDPVVWRKLGSRILVR